MNFSPKKLRISTTELLSDVTQLMGKWAYTVRILYSNPLVTPRIMLETWEHTVLTAAISFFFPKHLLTCNSSFLIICMSKAKCLKLRISLPRGQHMLQSWHLL